MLHRRTSFIDVVLRCIARHGRIGNLAGVRPMHRRFEVPTGSGNIERFGFHLTKHSTEPFDCFEFADFGDVRPVEITDPRNEGRKGEILVSPTSWL